MNLSYQIYHPAGNETILVEGCLGDEKRRRILNRFLLEKHPQVEQVGFLSTTGAPQLLMAGGEFCGNASRCAACYYLQGKEGSLFLKVCDGSRRIQVGIKKAAAWAEIPLLSAPEKSVRWLAPTLYEVKLDGITHLVCSGSSAQPKQEALALLEKYRIDDSSALGVVFVSKQRIQPVVCVKKIKTVFYETACGSGSVAVALVDYMRRQQPVQRSLQQPSGEWITATVTEQGACISGKVTQRARFSLALSEIL